MSVDTLRERIIGDFNLTMQKPKIQLTLETKKKKQGDILITTDKRIVEQLMTSQTLSRKYIRGSLRVTYGKGCYNEIAGDIKALKWGYKAFLDKDLFLR